MKLVVHELKTEGLIQEVTPSKNLIVEAIRPHIYRHNFATGSLQLQVLDASDNLLATSDEVAIDDIATDNFFHGYVRFLVNVGMKKDTPYKIKLIGTDGYSFSEPAYIGWCTGYDLGKYPEGYMPATDAQAALDLEIWTRSTK